MRSGFIAVIATFACLSLGQAHGVEAPEGPVSPVPESPAGAAATPYPQVTTPAVLTNGPLPDTQTPLPPIQLPAPPSRDPAPLDSEAESQALRSKSPGG